MTQQGQGDGFAWLVGANIALLHLAGALKSMPVIGLLPIDLTILLAMIALPLLVLLAALRRWLLAPALGLPMAAIGLFWLWLVLTGCWSASGAVLNAKLPEIILLGPVMLFAGMLVAGDEAALRGFAAATLGAGGLIALSLAANLAEGRVALGGLPGAEAEKWRVAYQVTGLAIAMAASLAALHWAEARGALRRFFWLGTTLALAFGAALTGGRAALLALGLCLLLGPLLILIRQQSWIRAGFGCLACFCWWALRRCWLRVRPARIPGPWRHCSKRRPWKAPAACRFGGRRLHWRVRPCPLAWVLAASAWRRGLANGAGGTRIIWRWKR